MICTTCDDIGEVIVSRAHNDGGVLHDEEIVACPDCDGTGESDDYDPDYYNAPVDDEQ